MKWIPISERKPAIGKLVYTKDDHGNIGVYTLYDHGWNSKVSIDNNTIIEWLDEEEEPSPLAKRSFFFRDLVYDYERYMEQGQTETALFILDHLLFQVGSYVREEHTSKVPDLTFLDRPVVVKARSLSIAPTESIMDTVDREEAAPVTLGPTDEVSSNTNEEEVRVESNRFTSKKRPKGW
jgi:hypothetical protein